MTQIGVIAGSCAAILRAEELSLQVASGREFRGELDLRTTPETLWLRTVRDGITLRRPIQWSQIANVRSGEKLLAIDELRTRATHMTQAEPVTPPIASTETVESLPVPAASPDGPRTVEYIAPVPTVRPARVRNLQIDVSLGHWSENVEPDGLVLTIYPLDRSGLVVAVDGTLEVDLIGEQPVGYRQGDVFPRIGRWTVAIHADDVGPNGARVELPFQAAHPEFDRSLGHLGLVHARLSVPGQGTFEASDAQVRIRTFSPIRDRSEQTRGTRFFPVERTGRGDRQSISPHP